MPYLLAAWAWLRANWMGAAACAVVGFAVGQIHGPGAGGAIAAAVATTGVTTTAQAGSSAEISLPGRPAMPCPPDKVCPPCEAVVIKYDCHSAVTAVASSQVSATAAVGAGGLDYGLVGGAGRELLGGQAWQGELGAYLGPVDLVLQANTDAKVLVAGRYHWSLKRK
jgi:hypothetical protein